MFVRGEELVLLFVKLVKYFGFFCFDWMILVGYGFRSVEQSIKLTNDMINLLIQKMRTITSQMKLKDWPSMDELENVKEHLDLVGDWGILLHGHLNILKTELRRDEEEQQGQTVKDCV